MAYTLPLDNLAWADFQILVTEKFAATSQSDSQYVAGGTNGNLPLSATSTGAWRVLPYKQRGLNKPGYFVQSFERVCLPLVGRAVIAFDYGMFDDVTVANPSPSELDTSMEVRIQVSPRGANQWVTVYWGTVDYVEDAGDPGAVTPRGRKLFHCVDGAYRMKRWTLDRHGAGAPPGASPFGAVQFNDVFGNPGYNFENGQDAPLLGNRLTSSTNYTSAAGVSVWYHQPAGSTLATDGNYSASLWTDRQAVEHAMGANKPIGEPCFSLKGATYLLDSTNPWQLGRGETVHDFVCRVLKRERGRGCAYVDWTEGGGATGPLTVFITVQPQLATDLTYTDPTTNTQKTVAGAITNGSAVTVVDIAGDHRCVAEAFKLGDPSQFRVDYLETIGEPIEVVATLSYTDGQVTSGTNQWDGIALTRGWSNTQQTNLTGLPNNSPQAKEDDRHLPTFQLHKFNLAWPGTFGDGENGKYVPIHRGDYHCDANGNIITYLTAVANKSTDPIDLAPLSPLLIEIMGDLPLYEGYTYAGAKPARWDGLNETDRQPRRRITAYVRTAPGYYVQADDRNFGVDAATQVDGKGIWVRGSGDEGNGTRFFAAPKSSWLSSSGGVYDYSSLVITAGLRLPSRVRFASGDPQGRRRGKIYHPGAHLWLISPGAIWSLDTSNTSSNGYAARRQALGGTVNGNDSTPGIIRDDRAGLAKVHALAWAWYGATSAGHRTAQWALRDCGFLPSYQAYAGTFIPSNGSSPTTVAYPTIGQVVQTINANGQTTTLNTPVTRVHYNNENGVTTWSTEWSELENVSR